MSRVDTIENLLEQAAIVANDIYDDLFAYKETNSDLVIEKQKLSSENEKLRKRVEILEEKIEDYSGFIEIILRYVPDEEWDDTYKEMQARGIECVGPDDV